ncbi:MAG: type II toxin-antitoxin system RelB/DinJ family antitoxin [Lacrimispora sphenoides]
MATTSVTIRMDENLKKQAETLFDEMGMNMTTAINIFAKAVVRQGKIPFEIAVDPFFTETNMKALRQAVKEADEGKLTAHDLIQD